MIVLRNTLPSKLLKAEVVLKWDFCIFLPPEKIFKMDHFQILSERPKVFISEHFGTNGLSKYPQNMNRNP